MRLTGMRILRALSAKFSEIPEPGNARTPIGMVSSIASLRLKGAEIAQRRHERQVRTMAPKPPEAETVDDQALPRETVEARAKRAMIQRGKTG